MTPAVWRGKRVMVTGHTGFKGSWLSLWLEHLGATVLGFALEPADSPNLFDLARLGGRSTSIIGDICDLDTFTRAVRSAAPEVAFHLAAQSLVRESYRDPVATYATNVMGTVHLLEAVRSCPSVRAVVVVTSDKCYENFECAEGYREDEAMGGHDPYSSSKGCAELVTAAYRRSFFSAPDRPGIASARAGNVIGGGDWAADRLIPDAMRAFSAGRPVIVRNPSAVRPWQHVLEPLSGYLRLAERLLAGDPVAEGWNFGPAEEDARPVGEVIRMVCEAWGPDAATAAPAQRDEPHEARLLRLDCTRARTRLGWAPRTDLATAIDWVVRWYRDLYARQDARELCLRDIRAFEERAR